MKTISFLTTVHLFVATHEEGERAREKQRERVRETETETETEADRERQRERQRERASVCVCMCVCVRERACPSENHLQCSCFGASADAVKEDGAGSLEALEA